MAKEFEINSLLHKNDLGNIQTTNIEFTKELQKQRTDTIKEQWLMRNENLSSESTITTSEGTGPSLKEPCQHIAFLKVHKAASSTTQNIFLRYGYSRGLTFVLSRPGEYYYPNIISIYTSVNENNTLPPPENKTFDILCCHVIYNREALEKIMPKDTVYIGIIREPSEHIRSVIQYFKPKEIYQQFNGSTDPISDFFKNPGDITLQKPFSFLNNRMAYEYNFPKHLFFSKNRDEINEYLSKLASEFKLVIVVEYFDESIVLMRRILNWSMKDILYTIMNEYPGNQIKISLENKQRHRQWAVLDYALYDFFFKRLWDQIRQEGKDFVEELNFFKTLRDEVTNFCSDFNEPYITDFKVPKSKWSDEFIVNVLDCRHMFRPEILFIQRIRKSQYGDLEYGMK